MSNPRFHGVRRCVPASSIREALGDALLSIKQSEGLTFAAACTAIEGLAGTVPEAEGDVAMMSRFLAESTRGIVR